MRKIDCKNIDIILGLDVKIFVVVLANRVTEEQTNRLDAIWLSKNSSSALNGAEPANKRASAANDSLGLPTRRTDSNASLD